MKAIALFSGGLDSTLAMKLIIAILKDQDADTVSRALTRKGFRVTLTASITRGGLVESKDFVVMREARDKELNAPKLLLPSVQFNMRGGAFPPPEDNGTRYFKIPLNIDACGHLD